MQKAKETVGEKNEKMTTSDPTRKEMAEEKKDERIHESEREKQVAYAYYQSAAERMAQQGGGAVFTTGGVHVLQDPDMGGEGDDEEVNRPASGTRGAGTRKYGTGPTGGP